MTTYIPFTPSQSNLFTAQVVLDGRPFTMTTPWNVFGRRYYVNLYGLNSTLIFSVPLVGSPTGIYLASLSWSFGVVTATTQMPHNYRVGDVLRLNIINCTPIGYNGNFDCQITGPNSFTYFLDANPGVNNQLGSVQYNLNLAAGYAATSMLVYRSDIQTFEVTP